MKQFISRGLMIFLLFISYLALFSAYWVKSYFNNIGISEMMYTMSQPLKGSDHTQIYDYLKHPFLYAILATIVLLLLNHYAHKKSHLFDFNKKKTFSFFFAFLVLFNLSLGLSKIGFRETKAYFFDKTTLYNEYYTNPKKVNLTFPEKPRNLVYLFVESLESSYASTEVGGLMPDNLIPNLTSLALNSEDSFQFSNTTSLGGALASPGTGFTAGGMIAQTSGVPIKITSGYNENEYEHTKKFLPGAYAIGQILEKQNYKQMLLLGSDASFAGRDKYFTQHGNYEIRDYKYAVQNEWISSDYSVWWGYEDLKLFDFAKKSLLELASNPEQPFNFTMLTADTHFPNGYSDENTPQLYGDQYSNVIHFSDQMIADFLSWMKEQPFYENTTIVISGDHLTMDADFSTKVPKKYTQTIYNSIINSPLAPTHTNNRKFTSMDLYPTTLASLGVQIDGERLALGTNLFSGAPTISEQLGVTKLNQELEKRSEYYQKNIMQGSDLTKNLETLPK